MIKNGKLIDIKSEVSKIMSGGAGAGAGTGAALGPDVALVSTPVDALLTTSQRNHFGPSLPPPSRGGLVDRPPPPDDVATLQVRLAC